MESVRSDRDTPSSKRSEYDVFLSFRGTDARDGIVDHLYERMTDVGLRVFKDDKGIRHGEVIGDELKRAIEGSRVYAVVFSRDYASSAWCLRELDMMVDLRGGSNVGGKIILPIFYKVEPSDVKLQTELYREALDKHKDRHSQDVLKKWEEALKTVGGISGWDSKAIQGEGRFVRLIVQDIVAKLRIKDQSLPNHLTGIDDRVSDMLNLLDCDSSGVRLVVLHGMGGIGKTTLARVIFNKLSCKFEGSSFISNVRESATGHGGIAKLQNKLSRDILGDQYARTCNFDDDFDDIIQRIRGKRMLLVLDDVDQFSQLEKLAGKDPKDTLGKGSRVIITTRDKSVCDRIAYLGSEILHYYEMEKMRDSHALQLFSRHAFGTDEPTKNYLSLSEQVVKTTRNLPLALVVIGGHLCCQSKETWEYMLEKLKNILHGEVFEILKVSYDGLAWREKEIFLDIACFRWDGMPRSYADYLWDARKLYPKTGVKVLINKSLIKIDSNGEFWIHDQLRNMGREIVQSKRLEKRTRVWEYDALKVVLGKKVWKKIVAVDLDLNLESGDEEHKLSDENFRGLSNLKYLQIEGRHQFIGNFGSILETLLWLSWRYLGKWSNPDIFEMSNLVVLKIEGGWRGFEKLMMPKLRVLQIAYCNMITSPDLSCCLKLEIMVFHFIDKLKEIHHSVGKLKKLTHMEIFCCWSLRSLPEEICYARALRELIVTHCKIEQVPESIGMLESLRTLNLRDNKIRRLPATIGDLENLLVMQAGDNPLEEGIPEEIGSLSLLEELDLWHTNIPFLPATASQLTSLKSLKLEGCNKLEELPRLPTSLTHFTFSWAIGGLSEEVKCGSEVFSPKRIIKLWGDLELGLLSRLKTLGLTWPLDTELEINYITKTELDLGGFIEEYNSLLMESNLGRLRSELKWLRIFGCPALVEIPGLEQLEQLETLIFSACPSIRGIQDLLGLKRLKRVIFWGCSSLVRVPRMIDECQLHIDDCDKLESFKGSYGQYGSLFSLANTPAMFSLSEKSSINIRPIRWESVPWLTASDAGPTN